MARQFDVFRLPGDVLVTAIQSDLLDAMATRVVVPLLPEEKAPPPISELNPVFEIMGVRHVLVTQALSAVTCRELKRPVASLEAERDSITRALDLLLIGF